MQGVLGTTGLFVAGAAWAAIVVLASGELANLHLTVGALSLAGGIGMTFWKLCPLAPKPAFAWGWFLGCGFGGVAGLIVFLVLEAMAGRPM